MTLFIVPLRGHVKKKLQKSEPKIKKKYIVFLDSMDHVWDYKINLYFSPKSQKFDFWLFVFLFWLDPMTPWQFRAMYFLNQKCQKRHAGILSCCQMLNVDPWDILLFSCLDSKVIVCHVVMLSYVISQVKCQVLNIDPWDMSSNFCFQNPFI